MPPAVSALLDSTTELINFFSPNLFILFYVLFEILLKNHFNVITADKLAVIHLRSGSFIHTSHEFSLCGLFFAFILPLCEIHFGVAALCICHQTDFSAKPWPWTHETLAEPYIE